MLLNDPDHAVFPGDFVDNMSLCVVGLNWFRVGTASFTDICLKIAIPCGKYIVKSRNYLLKPFLVRALLDVPEKAFNE